MDYSDLLYIVMIFDTCTAVYIEVKMNINVPLSLSGMRMFFQMKTIDNHQLDNWMPKIKSSIHRWIFPHKPSIVKLSSLSKLFLSQLMFYYLCFHMCLYFCY